MNFTGTFNKAVLVWLLSCSAALAARDAGTSGRTYPIAEPDALQEIRERAARVDWSRAVSRELLARKVEDFRPADLRRLPAAGRTRSFLVDMTFRLDRDIPDGRGGFLYRLGYAVNPLDYVRLTSLLVIIDGADPRQVAWFRKSPYARDFRTRLILSGGDYWELAEKLKRPVFYLMDGMSGRLRLEAVPSIVWQDGRKLRVTEVCVDEKE